MESLLQFKGTWRTYQERVLRCADNYLKDGRIHIVAAPGSGKTTLGIELIARINKPSLILAPSITIREQWMERIREGFLLPGVKDYEVLSNNLKQPKFITIATYQALHSAMTKARGSVAAEEEPESELYDAAIVQVEEAVDYSNFDLVETMKRVGMEVLCLDECHHLRSEWWKALENFRQAFEKARVIALTATPPYDSTPAMWKRYVDMCGEIDEEITIPELVKDGSLCPHQDYVLFNYPTKEEMKEIDVFKENSKNMMQQLLNDKEFEAMVRSHKGLTGEVSDELLLETPAYLSSLLIFLQEKKIPYPKRLQRLLGAKKLPAMEEKWMEQLLQGILYDDCDSYLCDKVYREELIRRLKNQGLIEKKKVCMAVNSALEKMLVCSKGKIESIKKIVAHEYKNMGSQLRQLILTDYIRKECEKDLGNPQAEMHQLGVLPFFELLRREAETYKRDKGKLRLGVLCGSMVIIPAEAKDYLLRLTGTGKVTFVQAGSLPEIDYLEVRTIGDAHFLTAAVTELFTKGYIQVLIGTKSLLGEGWDAPCVNSVILASFVGSFMLSNQMRGRAIRIDKNNPDKTSNIWHLVCITPPSLGKEDETGERSEDYQMLCRRMEHFLGLHYEEDTIESGVARLSAIHQPFTKANIKETNEWMLELSSEREQLKSRWQNSLAILEQMEVVDEVDISERFISMVLFYDALGTSVACSILFLVYLCLNFSMGLFKWGLLSMVLGMGLLVTAAYYGIKAWFQHSPLRRLKVFGKGILKAMLEKGIIATPNCKVETQTVSDVYHTVYLMGGTGKEKRDFAKCVSQFFDAIDNQRYLLVNQKRKSGLYGFFAVPEAFAKNKDDALVFETCMKQYIGNYKLVYTRNEEGRKLLLEGRVKALGSREERCINKKKVKGALE